MELPSEIIDIIVQMSLCDCMHYTLLQVDRRISAYISKQIESQLALVRREHSLSFNEPRLFNIGPICLRRVTTHFTKDYKSDQYVLSLRYSHITWLINPPQTMWWISGFHYLDKRRYMNFVYDMMSYARVLLGCNTRHHIRPEINVITQILNLQLISENAFIKTYHVTFCCRRWEKLMHGRVVYNIKTKWFGNITKQRVTKRILVPTTINGNYQYILNAAAKN